MRYRVGTILLLSLAVSGFSRMQIVVCGFSCMASAAQPRSVWAGVYTTQQADAGEKTYFSRCSTCHGDDLAGVERAPALADTQFLDSWHGKDLRRMLDRVMTMPPADKPVTTSEAIDLVAFLLRSSEMPSGTTALPADRAQLVEITF